MRTISSALLAAALIGIAPAAAGEAGSRPAQVVMQAGEAAQAAEFSAQRRRVRRGARTRLRVTPLRRAYRQCVDWYRVEYRPSGTVITPQMRCWWVGG